MYSAKAGDVFDRSPENASERKEARDIIKGQLEQEAGNSEEYAYADSRYHYYWGIMNGSWNVMSRMPDAEHPANGPWDPWKSPPEGVEPPSGGGYDPFNR